MKKEITFNEISRLFKVFSGWQSYSKDIKLGTISLYNLIAFKKAIEAKEMNIEETIRTIFLNNGAVDDQGMLKLPEDKQEKVTEEIDELGRQTEEVEYKAITVANGDNLPVELMEVLFDFIELKE